MKSSKQKIILTAQMLLTVSIQLMMSQTKGVVIDITTKQPISYVSIYTKNADSVLGSMSNEHGQFEIDFSFNTLFLSHINYEKVEIRKKNVQDTIFLIPTSVLLNEVVVNKRQPKWINTVLSRLIKGKGKNYQTLEETLSYKYETYTLTDSNGYAFKSKGNIEFPKIKKDVQFKIDAQNNTIKYKDKTAGVDFSNLRRMLYDDFVSGFNNKFLNEYDFSQNSSFVNKDKNIIQLIFNSKKFQDDEGYIVLDTLNNVILEAEKNSGTECNIKTQTSAILRSVAASRGFNYDTWITKSNTKYTKIGECYYISECKYKFYMKSNYKNKKVDSKYFTSIESKLFLSNQIEKASKSFIIIPKPYYIVAIMTKPMRLEEEALNNVPVSFEGF
ncbi:MAG: hypothetical protein EOL95_00020 [Bacteroidia bacterium]|nr:hypothetical protein [Bacteroidia bacterium]